MSKTSPSKLGTFLTCIVSLGLASGSICHSQDAAPAEEPNGFTWASPIRRTAYSHPRNVSPVSISPGVPSSSGKGALSETCYSANFSRGWNGMDLKFNPPGGRYGLCLHEMKLLTPNHNP